MISLLMSFGNAFSQPSFPENTPVFTDTIVPRVDILINPDTLDWIYDNIYSEHEFQAEFVFNDGSSVDTITEVGFRLRGNTSLEAQKKSFKISFNTYIPGRKWHGLEKLNLNGEHNDPSVVRAKLCWDLLRQFDVPAPRSNHVRVYINNDYYGLYINTEHIDEEFVKSRFGNNNGNLYKCLWPADLDFLGTDPESYKDSINDRRVYSLKTNTEADDYSDLAHFIDVLNNTSNDEFACELNRVFNVADYLKIIAVDVFTGNWDGYIYNKNNFYLYHNTATDKFEYINYDLDNTYGIDWVDRDWATRDIYDWQRHGDEVRPLYSRIMDNQELKDQFSYYLNILINDLAEPGTYGPYLDDFREMISQYVPGDPYYPLDYGWDYDDFINSYDEALGGHVDYGLKPYVETRRTHAVDQLELHNISPVVKYISNNLPHLGETVWIRAYVEDEDANPKVKLLYSENGGEWLFKFMYDDGEHGDGMAGDRIYGTMISGFQQNMSVAYQVSATDNFGYSTVLPCEPEIIAILPSQQEMLFINEFMADNDSTIADENGEYNDWIEIYNGDENEMWLGNKFMTDDLGVPDKWAMPDMTLAPGGFVLVWADGKPEQGPLHANFKLSKNGESIGIYDSEATDYFPLDTVIFGPQLVDISYGRLPDGAGLWNLFDDPTPGYTNVPEAVDDYFSPKNHLKLYPNPVNNGIIYFSSSISFVMYNAWGSQILQAKDVSDISVSNLKKGIYFLVTEDGERLKFIKY
jgi:hypothetical protein